MKEEMTENIQRCCYCAIECDYPEDMEELHPGQWVCIKCACEWDPVYGNIEIFVEVKK